MPGSTDLFERGAACAALRTDRDHLLAALDEGRPAGAEQAIVHNPLRGAPMTLMDLVTHVCMWDEIVLAVIFEARRGRAHWYLEPSWETVEAGRALNVGGIHAGREIPSKLSRHRFVSVRNALVSAIAEIPEPEWNAELPFRHSGWEPQTLSGLSYKINTPEADPDRVLIYQHATVHLGL